MRIAIVTDAWTPQVNGVVTTRVDLRERLLSIGHEGVVIEPSAFRTIRRCSGAFTAGRTLIRRGA